MGKKIAKIAAISCSHAPFTPEKTKDWVLSTLSEIKDLTHLVHLGDIHEGSCSSVHPRNDTHTLEDEFREASSFLDCLRAAVPKTVKLVACMGNHDDNILSMDPRRIDRALLSLVDWRKHPEFANSYRKWQWMPYEKSARCVYRVGAVHLFHGFDASIASDEMEGLQMVGMCGWQPHALTVRGHTHRPVRVTRAKRSAKIQLPYYHMNVGTCGPLKPDYAKRLDTSAWNAGMAVIEAVWDKPSKITGKSWTAELREMPR